MALQVLRKATKGLGTDDSTLIRILVTRAEIDLQKIEEEFLKKYKRPLPEVVHSETSGHYRAFLLSLLGSKY
jgi:annexin A7/11